MKAISEKGAGLPENEWAMVWVCMQSTLRFCREAPHVQRLWGRRVRFLPGICTEQIARKAGWGRVWVGWLVCRGSRRHSVMIPGSSVRVRKQVRGLESPEGLKEALKK